MNTELHIEYGMDVFVTLYPYVSKFINFIFQLCAGVYFTGDGASRDENGLYRISGRVDDIIMSKGHRIGTAELECAMVSDVYMYLPSLISC